MPEVWLFGLIFILIFSLFWTIIEIGIKWLVFENVIIWRSAWHSLLNSVFIQVLQILGVVFALFLSSQISEKWAVINNNTENFLLFILTFIFLKLIMDTTIGGLFLTVVKKNSERAWRASLAASFLGAFSLCTVIVLISNH